ncbi:MAG: hypothetical protein IJR48_03610 [Oscillibacter sp.]|nr:hypothetical protein [Oscillibacter sp.]
MTEYLIGAVAAALVNDLTLSREDGDTLSKLTRAACLGVVTVAVTLCACVVSYAVYYAVLAPLGLESARVPLCLLAAAGCAALLGRLARNSNGARAAFLETNWPLVALNAAVLGALVQGLSAGYDFAGNLLSALWASVLFAASLACMTAIQARMDTDALPASVRGLPAYLLTAALISMALMAFAGL